MTTLQFADTHNLVAFLTKSAESEGFEQIVDFLNASSIRYALTVNPTIYTSCIEQFWATVKVKTVNGEQQLQALVDGKKIIITEATVRRDLQLEDADGVDCLPNATIFEQLTLMGRPKEKDTQVPQSSVPSDPTNVADKEPSMQLKELMDFYTKLQQRVLDLENTKTAQAQEITSLKKREDASKQGRKIDDINKDAEITLVDETQGRYGDEDMFGVNDLDGDEVVVESEVTNKAGEKRDIVAEAVVVTDVVTIPVSLATITNVELTLAQTLAELKSVRPKTKGVVMQELSESTQTISLQLPSQVKGQGSKDKVDKAVNEEPSMQLKELMDFCTKLQQRVLDLENIKTAQAQEITSLKKRVKKLEKKGGSRTHKLKRLYRVGRSARVVSSEEASLGDKEDASKQGRKIHNIDADEDITLENVHDAEMFDVNDLDGDEVVVESKVTDKAGEKRNIVEEAVAVTDAVIIPVSAATITNVELTLAQTLVKGQGSKDKGKAKMIELEKPLKKKYQIKFNEEEALRLQAKLQAQEQQELTIEEKSTLFVQHLEKRKKHFAAKRVEEKRNRPPIRAQQRNIICTYLKNMAGWKPKDLKNKTELVEGTKMEESSKKAEVMEESSSKRAGDELQQESTKKQKMDDDQERG
ncbi:hypothetical protein Tco_1054733 [Tanacetum coccineum]|uniref:Xylulose kinase-1 n=1 Tax=Tanacetum coccineum TaxID=301880 RepID=A0ABQ5GXM8_9ASTR